MQKLAIFGGTFNPVHWGHLLVAETALDQFGLDRVIWVPTYHPAHKRTVHLLDFQHRTEMVRRAIDSHPNFSLSTIEQDQTSPSYAVHTFSKLQSTYPNNHWYWIIGLDTFQTLPHWYRHRELIFQCSWLVTPRWTTQFPGSSKSQENHSVLNPESTAPQKQATVCNASYGNAYSGRTAKSNSEQPFPSLCQQIAQTLATESLELKWHLLDMPPIGISSSLVRQRCGDCHSIRYLVPESVRSYILQQGLYQQVTAAGDQENGS